MYNINLKAKSEKLPEYLLKLLGQGTSYCNLALCTYILRRICVSLSDCVLTTITLSQRTIDKVL